MTVQRGAAERLLLPALSAAALLVSTTGCSGWSDFGSSGYTTQNYYAMCVDPNTGIVVSMTQCQQNPGYYYIAMTPNYYHTGGFVPLVYRTGSGYFRYNDSTARSRIGLPATGGIKSGSKVVSRAGGFDSAHTGAHAGDGGGHGSAGHGSGGG